MNQPCPDLLVSVKQLRGQELLKQIIEPSSMIHEKYQTYKFLLKVARSSRARSFKKMKSVTRWLPIC